MINCTLSSNTTLGDEDFGEPVDVGVGLQRSAVSAIFMEAFSTNQLEDIAQTALTFLSGKDAQKTRSMSLTTRDSPSQHSARSHTHNPHCLISGPLTSSFIYRTVAGLEEFSCFMLSQLYLECQRLDSARERLYNENKQLKSDAVRDQHD